MSIAITLRAQTHRLSPRKGARKMLEERDSHKVEEPAVQSMVGGPMSVTRGFQGWLHVGKDALARA